ncbi:Protein STPG3 [Galemys pyrenaicus]|uniref:Protein STPG3 n=1 Tax=Galemys pyrenaicus TaxID=202257 RepID=A0A8J6AHV4_GALPY|nr:Protein STPG3 [Galemys pyrenaicus]
MERRPPLLLDLDTPGPTAYPAPDASLRESSPHPSFSIGRKHPGRGACRPAPLGAMAPPLPQHMPLAEGGGRRAWQTAWLQSESPFTQKTDFGREQKWPSPADYQPWSWPACPAARLGGHRLVARTPEAHGRLTPQAPVEQRPGPAAYDIAPGCRLRSPHPPAFSMGRSPLSASWIRSSRTPGPAAYRVEDRFSSRFPTAPGVLIQGERRPKRHDTGPFCAV